MFTIIGADGKEYGPVSADKLRDWIVAGRANAQTQVRRDGEAAWSTLGSLPEFSEQFAAVPPAYAGAAPAAAPAASTSQRGPIDTKAYADAIAASGARVDVFECLSRSFSLWTGNFLPLVGATLLVMICALAIGIVPILGNIAGLVLNGVLYGGLYYYYLGKMRGQHREIGDAFAGFSRAFGPLALCSLLQAVIVIALTLVFMAPILGFLASFFVLGRHGGEAAFPVLAPPMIAYICVGALVMIYFAVCCYFAFALVIDKGLGPWDAIVTSWRVTTRNWFAVFFTILLGGILAMLGLIGLIVGVFLTVPLAFGAILYAYESLFNTPQADAALAAATRGRT